MKEKANFAHLKEIGAVAGSAAALFMGTMVEKVPISQANSEGAKAVELAEAPKSKTETPTEAMIRVYKDTRSIYEQMTYSHKPQMLYGAMEIMPHKKIVGDNWPEDGGSLTLEPGGSYEIENPILINWHHHKIVYVYGYQDRQGATNRIVDIKGVNIILKKIKNGTFNKPGTWTKSAAQHYMDVNNGYYLDWNRLQKNATVSYWKSPTNVPGPKMLTTKPVPRQPGYLVQDQSNGYMATARIADFRRSDDGGFVGYGGTATKYLAHYGYKRAPNFRPNF